MLLVPLSPNREISIIAEPLAAETPGKIDAASLGSAYADIMTMGGNAWGVILSNSTDQSVMFSIDGGSSDFYELDAGEGIALDLRALGLYASAHAISAKWTVLQPSTGSVRATILRV